MNIVGFGGIEPASDEMVHSSCITTGLDGSIGEHRDLDDDLEIGHSISGVHREVSQGLAHYIVTQTRGLNWLITILDREVEVAAPGSGLIEVR